MSEMIERVAKAIYDISSTNDVSNWNELVEMPQHSIVVTYYRTRAKAAIEALREPTSAMLNASHMRPSVTIPSWKAMIDAALKD